MAARKSTGNFEVHDLTLLEKPQLGADLVFRWAKAIYIYDASEMRNAVVSFTQRLTVSSTIFYKTLRFYITIPATWR